MGGAGLSGRGAQQWPVGLAPRPAIQGVAHALFLKHVHEGSAQ